MLWVLQGLANSHLRLIQESITPFGGLTAVYLLKFKIPAFDYAILFTLFYHSVFQNCLMLTLIVINSKHVNGKSTSDAEKLEYRTLFSSMTLSDIMTLSYARTAQSGKLTFIGMIPP